MAYIPSVFQVGCAMRDSGGMIELLVEVEGRQSEAYPLNLVKVTSGRTGVRLLTAYQCGTGVVPVWHQA